MRNIELVDYLVDIRDKYEILGGSDGEAPDEFITSEHNKVTGSSMSKTGQYEYYTNHKKYGEDFKKILKDLNNFSREFPNLLKELFSTDEPSSGFNYVPKILSSDDKNESNEEQAYEWEKAFTGEEGEIRIPFNVKSLHSSNAVHLVKNPNWRKLEDPERRIDNGPGIYRDNNQFYGIYNQSAMDVLNAFLSKKMLIFTSHPNVGWEEDFQYELDHSINGINYRIGTFRKYPPLHTDIKTYLGLLKKFFGIILKIEEIKYNAIDIIPINSDDIAIYIATNLAQDINTDYNLVDEIKNDVNYKSGNLMRRIDNAYKWLDLQNCYDDETGEYISDINEGHMANDSLYFSFYKRDRKLRFNSILSTRLDRINDSILSLNKLHNPTNYKFEKEDFDDAYKSIKESLSNFESKYKSYFETKVFKAKDKIIEENERLRKENERLKKARKGEKNNE